MQSRFPWRKYPVGGPPEIDRNNPISRGLVNCIWPGSANSVSLRDLAQPEYAWPQLSGGTAPGLRTMGLAGFAPNFTTANAYTSSFVPATFIPKNGFSVAFVAQVTTTSPAADRAFFGWGNSGNNNPLVLVHQESGAGAVGHINGYIRDNGGTSVGWVSASATEQLPLNKPITIVVTYTPADPYRSGLVAWIVRTSVGGFYLVQAGTIGTMATPDRFAVNGLQRAALSLQGESPIIGPWVWDRTLNDYEAHKVLENPFLTFKRRYRNHVFAVSAGLTLDIDNATVTAAGQTVGFSVGLAIANGTVTAEGQSVAFGTGLAIGNGTVTAEGQSFTTSLGLAIGNGTVTAEGQDVEFALSANLFLDVDNGTVTAEGQDWTFDISTIGPIDLEIDAGTVTAAGQDWTLVVSSPSRGSFGRGQRQRIKLRRPEEIPPFEFDLLIRQPSQDFTCEFEVSSEETFELEQAPSEPFIALSVSSEITVKLEQAWQDFYSNLIAGAMRGPPPPVMPLHKVARAQVRIYQPPQAFDIELETSE